MNYRKEKVVKIYLMHQISGLDYDTVVNYFWKTKRQLESFGYIVLHPMTGKSYLRNEIEFKAHGYDNPASTNHAIIERDYWMVKNSDIVLADLRMDRVSIGMIMELAWAYAF